MKILFKSFLYYINSLFFDVCVFMVGKMKSTGFLTNLITRYTENMGERLIKKKKALEKLFLKI